MWLHCRPIFNYYCMRPPPPHIQMTDFFWCTRSNEALEQFGFRRILQNQRCRSKECCHICYMGSCNIKLGFLFPAGSDLRIHYYWKMHYKWFWKRDIHKVIIYGFLYWWTENKLIFRLRSLAQSPPCRHKCCIVFFSPSSCNCWRTTEALLS